MPSRFRVDLPSAGASRLRLSIQQRRVLVADDEASVRQVMRQLLTRAGFEVSLVSDGEAAWRELLRQPYELLVTDNEMPYLAGLQLIQRIRKEGLTTPVILISGTYFVNLPWQNSSLRIAAVLPKPFSYLQLMDAVRSALENPGGDCEGSTVSDPVPTTARPSATSPRNHEVCKR